ncbi:MAG: hypothetical protein KA191_10500 [Verrucomicrobia bacterium]|nr:hypothetical protein [Verrucomicrobiota bacterium]NMD20335.1 hypothetical protein [Verrucomicrobiota bacterium]HOU86860.1 hypothetical protein [Verrucomicrobiota bacterium]HPV09634.1 hypothetical protein [Verrucomicrobiota bacterium]HPW80826.1 hypothetical protein [Verrucomicrobiota bacterium]
MVQDYDELIGRVDVDQSVPVADRLLGRYGPGSIAGISFDKGFTRAANRELLRLYIPDVVMPKRGRKSATQTAAESTKTFVALRRRHSAVESDIAAREHHGLEQKLQNGHKRGSPSNLASANACALVVPPSSPIRTRSRSACARP